MAVSAFGVCQRVVAAVFGGYTLANLLPSALVTLLPMGRAEAAMTALLMSFAVYAAAILWAFAARNVWLACGGLLIPSALGGVLLAARWTAL